MWILASCFCVLLIFIKGCQLENACIDGGLQQIGSCNFSTGTCNYALTGWKRITGPYRFFFTTKLPGAHSKGGYIVFDYTVPDTIRDIKVISPWLLTGHYNFSFWYVLENTNSVLNVSLQTKTSTKMLWKASRTSPVKTWTPITLDLDSRQDFQIVFRTSNPLNVVGIDDIRVECKAYSPTTTPFAITNVTVTPTISQKPNMTTITEPITPLVTIKPTLATTTEPITPSITVKPHLVTLTGPITPSITAKPHLATTTGPITPTIIFKPDMATPTVRITPSITMKQHLVTITEPITPSITTKTHLATTAEAISPTITTKPHLVTITEPITPSVTVEPHLVTTTEPITPSVIMKPHLVITTVPITPSITMKPLMVTSTPKTSAILFTANSPVVFTTTPTITPTATMKILPTTAAVTTQATISSANPTGRTMTSIPSKIIALRLEDAIHPGCSSSGWNISVDMSLLRKLYPDIVANNIYFGDNTCRGVEKRTQLLFHEGFRDCLTREQISGGVSVYHNALFYAMYDPVNPFIIRQYKWTFSVECDVSRNEVTSTHIHHDIDAHHSLITGHHSINMAFFKDPNFMNQISGNLIHVQVGDEVYVKVFTTEADWSVKMRLHTCFTKPTDDSTESTKYYIIKDGCETDSNTHIISQSTHETRFVFQDFVYSTNKEGLNMYCNVTFCDTKDYIAGCKQSCTSKETQALVGK